MDKKEAGFILARYLFLVIIAIPSLFWFYLVFTPLTAYPTKIIFETVFELRVVEQANPLLPVGFGEVFFTNVYEFLSSTFLAPLAKVIFNPPTVFYLPSLNAFAELIPACIAGAAYYLLLVLNLTTPMKIKKRMLSLLLILGTFLVLNIIRLAFFAKLLNDGYQYFDLAHMAVWYFGSTVMVLLIWFSNVLIFKIRALPVYDDFKGIFSDLFKDDKTAKG